MLNILYALKGRHEEIAGLLDGHRVEAAEGAQLPPKKSYDVILLEGEMEDLSSIKKTDPRTEVIIFSRSEADAIEAISRGASAHFAFPVDAERFKQTLEDIRGLFAQRREIAELEKALISKYNFSGIVGKNPLMLDVFNFMKRIAPYYKTVTISGETGTGKEVIARTLHAISPVSKSPFVACNCGALVESLIESELFGHVKGAFTGAVSDKIGLFEAARDGTIFLDEVGELPLSFQPHLLRVLQDGEFRRVGSHQPSKARCRVIAASNRDLAAEVKKGRFREDLYYRLTPLILSIPPLRDRKDDIPLLCRLFLERFGTRTGKHISGISRPAQSALMSHDWPGNVREMESSIEQAAIMTTESFIRLEDIPPYIREKPRAHIAPGGQSLDEAVKMNIIAALEQSGGNRTKAAELLGISRRALLRKMEKYSIK